MGAPRASPSPDSTGFGLEKVELDEKGLGDVKMFSEHIHWKERIHSHISLGKPELGALLIWAQEQPKQITEEIEKGYAMHSIEIDVVVASSMVYDLLGRKVTDDMRSRKLKAGAMRGLEFWRMLFAEYEGTSAAAQHARLKKFMRTPRVNSMTELSRVLSDWEVLGNQCGDALTDAIWASMLEDLVPEALRDRLLERQDLTTLQDKLGFVRTFVINDRNAKQKPHLSLRRRHMSIRTTWKSGPSGTHRNHGAKTLGPMSKPSTTLGMEARRDPKDGAARREDGKKREGDRDS
jgi:hypothetical protein